MVLDEQQPSLDNTLFYVPIDEYDNVYCLINDGEHEDIIQLTKDHIHKNYQVYRPSLKTFIDCQNGNVLIRVLLLKNNNFTQSEQIEVNLNFDSFKQTSMLNYLNLQFEKIKALTEMNMKIYKDILEVTGK